MPEFLDVLAASTWLYVIVFAFAALDALLPFMPSESTVIAVGVLAASGRPHLALVIALAAAGAFAGDNIAYLVGRHTTARPLARLLCQRRWRARYDWALRTMRERGGLIIVVGRYIPGGRVTTMLAAGALRYPPGRFRLFDALATSVWAVWSALIGYLVGAAFDHDPLKAWSPRSRSPRGSRSRRRGYAACAPATDQLVGTSHRTHRTYHSPTTPSRRQARSGARPERLQRTPPGGGAA